MFPLHPHLTLALGIDDIIQIVVYGIIGIFVVAGWINNARKAPGGPRQGGAAGGMTNRAPGADTTGTSSANLEELAARRRRQLQELARQRQARVQTSGQSTVTPDNLSMRDATERARAKAEYERRAAALREQQERQHAAEQQRQAAARRAQQQQRTAKQRAQQQQRQAQQQRMAQRRILSPSDSPAPAETQSRPAALTAEAPVAAAAAGVPLASVKIGSLGRRSLREAIVLKEILDKPLALRDWQDELA